MHLSEHVLHWFLFSAQQISSTWRGWTRWMNFAVLGELIMRFCSFLPSPPITCPPLQISVSFFCLPWDIWLSGLPACEKPLICTALTLFLARTGKLVSFFFFFAKWLNSSDDARISHAKLLQSEVKRNDPIVVKWVWSGRGSFCNNVTYIPLTIMGFSKREISGVEFTAAAEFSTPHNPSFKNKQINKLKKTRNMAAIVSSKQGRRMATSSYLRCPTAVAWPEFCCPSWWLWGRSRRRSSPCSAARKAGARSVWWCWFSRRPAPRWPELWTSTPYTRTPNPPPCWDLSVSLFVSPLSSNNFCFFAHEGFLWGAGLVRGLRATSR